MITLIITNFAKLSWYYFLCSGVILKLVQTERVNLLKSTILFFIVLFQLHIEAAEYSFTRDVKGELLTREHCRPTKGFGLDMEANKGLCGKRHPEGYHLCTSAGKPYYLYVFSSKNDCGTALNLLRKYISEK